VVYCAATVLFEGKKQMKLVGE